MSRGQENQVFNTSTSQNATAANNAQQSYNSAQGDISNYENQLSQFAAANPYGQGGQLQTAQNQATANTADAASQAANQQMQSQAVRTGQNASGGIAAGQAANEANTRNLMQQQAQNNASRISSGADYNKSVLSASEEPAKMESTLNSQELGAQTGSLNTAQGAAQTPDFEDELTSGLMSAGTAFAGGAGAKFCWIAAELFGGWENPRTILVRLWLQVSFTQRWYGPALLAAYARWGERTAEEIKTCRWKRWIFQRLFDFFLEQAELWLNTKEGRQAARARNLWLRAESPYRLNLEAENVG
jgi:hypothetical protein